MYLGKVDATVHKKLAEKYNVKGFPTLYFFVDGVPKEYDGGREQDEIVEWVLKKVMP